ALVEPSTGQLFESEASFSGAVEVVHVIFAAEDSGFAVVEVRDDAGGEFVATGTIGHLKPGERAKVTGQWTEHQKFGPQVQVFTALPMDPSDRAGQVAYLSSLRHIGPVRA